ncbi:DUF2589 domain-containing protein [Thalassotalea nanhaiensis]|uniref:DUF2589 domain-containing protein n=1 Tax=Thalassotalea nanhaiensis TaxID=3065648 RepID=A0ABY9TQF0_9GAMM|nr:DUF2589 domain-containing protein [Colwelliaceae bacterium SQ345]
MAGVAEQFRGLPMEALIGGPLMAACKAQYHLATVMVEFITTIGFTGKPEKQVARTLNFDLTRPVDDGTTPLQTQTITINAPLLGLVPIPALLIESVTVDFTMEVKSSTQDTAKSSSSLDASASGGFFGVSFSVKGSVATSRENTRSTDNSAKYNVNVIARQQQPQEGMSKMMDLLASAVDPIAVNSGS